MMAKDLKVGVKVYSNIDKTQAKLEKLKRTLLELNEQMEYFKECKINIEINSSETSIIKWWQFWKRI